MYKSTAPATEAHHLFNDKMIWRALFPLIFCSVFAALAVNRYAPAALNADMILQSIISLQNVTLFYWGQNRFANVLPLLLQPITDPGWNLLGMLWAYAVSLFALLALLSIRGTKFLFSETSELGHWLSFLISAVVIFVGFSAKTCEMFVVEGQPYPPSFFLCAMAATLIVRKIASRITTVIGLLFLSAAIGINPSLVLLIVPLSTMFLWSVDRWRLAVFVGSSILIFGIWTGLSQLEPALSVSYFTLDLENAKVGLSRSAERIFDALDPAFYIFAFSAIIARWIMHRRSKDMAHVDLAVIILGFLGIGWFLAFAMSSWVKVNDYGVRYFSVTLLALVGMVAIPLVAILQQVKAFTQTYVVALLIFAFLAQVLRAPVPLDEYAVIRDTSSNVLFAEQNGIKFIAGDYWKAWPTVFQLMRLGHQSFGLAGRGEGNRKALLLLIDEDTQLEVTPKALCVSEPFKTCAWWASHITGRTWNPPTSTCPDISCRVITMEMRGDGVPGNIQ